MAPHPIVRFIRTGAFGPRPAASSERARPERPETGFSRLETALSWGVGCSMISVIYEQNPGPNGPNGPKIRPSRMRARGRGNEEEDSHTRYPGISGRSGRSGREPASKPLKLLANGYESFVHFRAVKIRFQAVRAVMLRSKKQERVYRAGKGTIYGIQ